MPSFSRQGVHALLLWCVAALLLCGAAVCAQDCSRHCFSGALDFGADVGESVEFNFGFVPCTQTLSGHIDQVLLEQFVCNEAANQTLDIVFQSQPDALPFYALHWIYDAGNATCAELLAGGLDVSGLTLLEARHLAMPTPLLTNTTASASLAAFERVCLQDCEPRCFALPLELTGAAGESSPCGLAGATQCSATLTFTLTPCTGVISGFDVLLGPSAASLAAYDPARLGDVELSCADGALALSAVGVFVEWSAVGAACDALLDNIGTTAIGQVQQAMVVLGADDEAWSSTLAQGAQTALALAACEDPAAAAANATDGDDAFADHTRPVRKPVVPTLACNAHLPGHRCCAVFGYRNPGTKGTYVPRREGRNWFLPEPHNRDQRAYFHSDTEDEESFSVFWDCDPFERTMLKWTLRVPAKLHHLTDSESSTPSNSTTGGEYYYHNTDYDILWERSVTAFATRDDCSDAQKSQWCQLA